MRPVIFDTDIGTDVDDILALVLLAKAPELKLLGVTTVYGDTVFRAKIAKATTRHAVPERYRDYSGRTAHRERSPGSLGWTRGRRGPGVDSVEVQAKQSAPSYISETAEALEGELEVIATGPLTNIARAITAAPAACARIKHLYVMGGAFWMNRAEHNIKCDAEAARVVFGSGIATTVISLDLTLRVRLDKNDLPRIAALANGLGPLLKDQLIRWWEYTHAEGNSPHDPLAALAMVRPELFRFEDYDIDVHDEASAPGFTTLVNQAKGKIRVGVDVFARTAEQEIVRRIVA